MLELVRVKGTGQGDLWFIDRELDKVYTPSFKYTETYMNRLKDLGDTIDENFDIEDAESLDINEYYNVMFIVAEENTYKIKDEIKAEGGKWNGKNWVLPKQSKKFKTDTYVEWKNK